MDKKHADGQRIHFRNVFTSTPVLLVSEGVRHAVVIINEGSSAVRIGHSGTISTLGLYLPGGVALSDNYSKDEWWVSVSSGSGTVSGFVVP